MKKRTGYLSKRGDTWQVEWKVNGKRFKRSLGTGDRRKAKAEADKLLSSFQAQDEAEMLAALTSKLERAKTTATALQESIHLGAAWTLYTEAKAKSKRRKTGAVTLRDYESIFYIFKGWMGEHHPEARTLRDVTAAHAEEYLEHLETDRKLTGNRINKHSLFLRGMFAILAPFAAMTTNPWDGIEKNEHTPAHRRSLTIAELRTVIEGETGELQTLFMVGAFSGLRLADCACLQWSEVDLERGIMAIIPRKTKRRNIKVTIGIPAILGARLAEIEQAGPYVMPSIASHYERDRQGLSKRLQAAFNRAGITTKGEGTERRQSCLVGFHSLRHTYITLQAQAGTPQAVLQKLAGHRNPAMTEHYTHIDEATATATARALPMILGDVAQAREPLPAWAVEAIKNAKSLKSLRDEMGVK